MILLSGGKSHPHRIGPVASCIARLCRKWKQQRTEAKRTREGELEAKRRRHEEGEGEHDASFAILRATEQVTRMDDPRLVQAAEQVTNSKIQIRAMDEATRAMNEATQAMNEATRAMNEAAQGLCGSAAQIVIFVAPK